MAKLPVGILFPMSVVTSYSVSAIDPAGTAILLSKLGANAMIRAEPTGTKSLSLTNGLRIVNVSVPVWVSTPMPELGL